jgi:hypothetical protein
MIIAVDTDLVTYALKFALSSKDDGQVNYICQRITECIPQMQRTLTIWLIQDIDDYMKNNDPSYLKSAPLKRLYEILKSHLKEFAK